MKIYNKKQSILNILRQNELEIKNSTDEIFELAKNLHEVQQQAVIQTLSICKPKVDAIINSKSKDIKNIEHTLDALCDLAFDDEVLLLFKKLCRYYYYIDPVATAEYVNCYREMWDNEEDDK